MISAMNIPKTETEGLLLSITENCGNFLEQTHTRPQKTLDFKHSEPRKTLSFKPFFILGLDYNWMVGLIDLLVYNSIFIITEENNKFALCTDSFGQFPFTELKFELEEIPNISNISHEHLQNEIIGLRIITT